MSKMDQTQFAKACGALASAWNNISESGQVFGINNNEDEVYVQMQWETMRELFPDTQIEFFERDCASYPQEVRIAIEGVTVLALLTDEQKHEAQDKEAE